MFIDKCDSCILVVFECLASRIFLWIRIEWGALFNFDYSYMYIVFEWGVGTGKSTQSRRLAVYLQKLFPEKEVVRTREPGWTEIAESIRTLVQWTEFMEKMDPVCEAYLYAAARAQLLSAYIQPVLLAWWIVVCDRNFCSSLANQWAGNNISMEEIRNINKAAVQNILPEYILYLDIPAEEWRRRTSDRNGDRHETKSSAYHEAVRNGYLTMSSWELFENRRHTIDAQWTQDEIFERILDAISPFLRAASYSV